MTIREPRTLYEVASILSENKLLTLTSTWYWMIIVHGYEGDFKSNLQNYRVTGRRILGIKIYNCFRQPTYIFFCPRDYSWKCLSFLIPSVCSEIHRDCSWKCLSPLIPTGCFEMIYLHILLYQRTLLEVFVFLHTNWMSCIDLPTHSLTRDYPLEVFVSLDTK